MDTLQFTTPNTASVNRDISNKSIINLSGNGISALNSIKNDIFCLFLMKNQAINQ